MFLLLVVVVVIAQGLFQKSLNATYAILEELFGIQLFVTSEMLVGAAVVVLKCLDSVMITLLVLVHTVLVYQFSRYNIKL